MKVSLNYKNAICCESCLYALEEKALKARQTLLEGTGPGNDFIGWVKYPKHMIKKNLLVLNKQLNLLKKMLKY